MKKDEETKTFGIKPENIARLFGLAVNDKNSQLSTVDKKAYLLEAQLSGTLPLNHDVIKQLPVILGKLCNDILPLGGKCLKDVILDKDTNITILNMIRDYFKDLAKAEESENLKSVYIAIYYSAIASALTFHNEKITSHSYPSLVISFKELSLKDWISPELGRHFMMAEKVCEEKDNKEKINEDN